MRRAQRSSCLLEQQEKRYIKQTNKQNNHLHAVADVVQHVVVDGLADVPDGTLHVGRSDDLMGPQRALVGGQDPDLPPGHLLFMDVHGLEETGW